MVKMVKIVKKVETVSAFRSSTSDMTLLALFNLIYFQLFRINVGCCSSACEG
jgi:hypothetical protein